MSGRNYGINVRHYYSTIEHMMECCRDKQEKRNGSRTPEERKNCQTPEDYLNRSAFVSSSSSLRATAAVALPFPFARLAFALLMTSPTMISSSDSSAPPPSDAVADGPASAASRFRCSSFAAFSSFHISERLCVCVSSVSRKLAMPAPSQSALRSLAGYSLCFLCCVELVSSDEVT